MPRIPRVTLEIDLIDGGARARARVSYTIEFTEQEVQAGFRYREFCHLISDDRNQDDLIPADPVDLGVRPLIDQTLEAEIDPIVRNLTSNAFDARLLDEDLGRDEVRARVVLTPLAERVVKRSRIVRLG